MRCLQPYFAGLSVPEHIVAMPHGFCSPCAQTAKSDLSNPRARRKLHATGNGTKSNLFCMRHALPAICVHPKLTSDAHSIWTSAWGPRRTSSGKVLTKVTTNCFSMSWSTGHRR